MVTVGAKNKKFLHIKKRFIHNSEPISLSLSPEMALDDPSVETIPSYSRILMCREFSGTIPIYNHSGLLLKLATREGNITSYLMELDNQDSKCQLVLTPDKFAPEDVLVEKL